MDTMPEDTMPEDSRAEPPPSAAERHRDKYSDPRVQIETWQLLLLGLLLTVIASFVALASIYARRTSLDRTTEFFGASTITALQLADRVQLLPGAGQDFEPVELSGTPGLGHLRRALLDDRHYLWETEEAGPVAERCEGADSFCVKLRFADPVGRRVPVTEIALELDEGWVGQSGTNQRVRLNRRVQPAVRHQLMMMSNMKSERYDQRTRG